MQNHTHRDEVGLRQRVLEEVTGRRAHTSFQPGGGNVFLRDRFDNWQIEADTGEMRVSLRDLNAEQAGRAADIAEGPESRKVKLLRERLEVDARGAGHRTHELFQSGHVRVEFLEHAFLPVFDLVLRPAGSQGLGQIVPKFEQPCVEHDQKPADVPWAGFVQEHGTFGRVEIFCLGSVAVSVEKLHRHKRVKKVGDGAWMEVQFPAQLRAGETPIRECGEQADLNGREQDLGPPKTKGGLQDRRRIHSRVHVVVISLVMVTSLSSGNFRSPSPLLSSHIGEKPADIDKYPHVGRGILACDREDEVGFGIRVKGDFLTPKISYRKFGISDLRSAGRRNGIDARFRPCGHVNCVEERLIRLSEPIDTDKFDIESFSGWNGQDDDVLDAFSITKIDGSSRLKWSLSHLRISLYRQNKKGKVQLPQRYEISAGTERTGDERESQDNSVMTT